MRLLAEDLLLLGGGLLGGLLCCLLRCWLLGSLGLGGLLGGGLLGLLGLGLLSCGLLGGQLEASCSLLASGGGGHDLLGGDHLPQGELDAHAGLGGVHQFGLYHDDALQETPEVKEALSRLPQDLLDD